MDLVLLFLYAVIGTVVVVLFVFLPIKIKKGNAEKTERRESWETKFWRFMADHALSYILILIAQGIGTILAVCVFALENNIMLKITYWTIACVLIGSLYYTFVCPCIEALFG